MRDATVDRIALTPAPCGYIGSVPHLVSISRKTKAKTMRSPCWSAERPYAHVYGGHQLRSPSREVFQLRRALCLAIQTTPFRPPI
jgi:hypothetical protein